MATTVTRNAIIPLDAPANLAGLLVREIRKGRRIRLHLHRERLRHRHTREVLHTAVAMLRDTDRQLDRARQNSADSAEHSRRLVADVATLKAEIARLRPQGPRARHVVIPKGGTTYNEAVQ